MTQDRTVHKTKDGQWANQRQGATRPSDVHRTQAEAIQEARDMITRNGGGELTIMGADGQIRDKRTVGPKHDPYPPKG
ncbi:MAG: DUF2188 domain-containing protein [Phycisphaerae bacterium]